MEPEQTSTTCVQICTTVITKFDSPKSASFPTGDATNKNLLMLRQNFTLVITADLKPCRSQMKAQSIRFDLPTPTSTCRYIRTDFALYEAYLAPSSYKYLQTRSTCNPSYRALQFYVFKVFHCRPSQLVFAAGFGSNLQPCHPSSLTKVLVVIVGMRPMVIYHTSNTNNCLFLLQNVVWHPAA